ncbi:TetR/AcrR family transcriptional regulator [Saccharomonospora sp. NB11]|jgi:AcrR family transcriptional regulator|uniref:TetR/AcrR family transcriptional regulator n=1 Tax=Saccharomonospora sp. NB11 TaxID=1642298 RepID=UPI001E449DBE|nr:TetR/AcrR family transcriptional regulator [Saccharomonospora sp. NB11]
MAEVGLRERKKEQTRQALRREAMRLFLEKGYAETTVAEIAAAADVSTKTLFNYFGSKEDILLAHRRRRVDHLVARLREHTAALSPKDALLAAAEDLLRWIVDGDGERLSTTDQLAQGRLVLAVPELRSGALALLYDAQLRLATVLHDAYPEVLSRTQAAAAVGAVIGAMQSAGLAALAESTSPTEVVDAARDAVRVVTGGLDALPGT